MLPNTTNDSTPLAFGSTVGLGPDERAKLDALLDHIYEYGTAAEGVTRRAADLCAAARAAARDCRTCAHHTYASGGCVSALRCVGGDRYQPTQPRQLWEQRPPKPAPF